MFRQNPENILVYIDLVIGNMDILRMTGRTIFRYML